jgi:hypothetical protein
MEGKIVALQLASIYTQRSLVWRKQYEIKWY